MISTLLTGTAQPDGRGHLPFLWGCNICENVDTVCLPLVLDDRFLSNPHWFILPENGQFWLGIKGMLGAERVKEVNQLYSADLDDTVWVMVYGTALAYNCTRELPRTSRLQEPVTGSLHGSLYPRVELIWGWHFTHSPEPLGSVAAFTLYTTYQVKLFSVISVWTSAHSSPSQPAFPFCHLFLRREANDSRCTQKSWT